MYCGVAYESVQSFARGHVIRVCEQRSHLEKKDKRVMTRIKGTYELKLLHVYEDIIQSRHH